MKILDFLKGLLARIFGSKPGPNGPDTAKPTTGPIKNKKGTTPNWFMYHGGYNHGGYAGTDSNLTVENVKKHFGLLKSIDLQGSILSVPAVVDGHIYIGMANSHKSDVIGSNGGTLYQVEIPSGEIKHSFSWNTGADEGDSHGFYGMGCTPAVTEHYIYYSAFNGHVYCLNRSDLSHHWDTDLRHADPGKNQPISNTAASIIKNIFDQPALLANNTAYIAGVSTQALSAVVPFFEGSQPDLGKELKVLAEQLQEAKDKDLPKKVDKKTKEIAGKIAQGITSDPPAYKTFLLSILPELGLPPAAGWCSPVVVESNGKSRVYVGVAEGENPLLYGFIYALDGESGNLDWVFCTTQFESGQPNPVNQLPAAAIGDSGVTAYSYTPTDQFPVSMGCSVWSAIAYDEDTGLLYASTGNPQPDSELPSAGYSNGILALNAASGAFVAFRQIPADTAYRTSDIDIDIASACTVFELKNDNNRKVVAVGCKNGGFMVCDANTLDIINYTSLLPRKRDGSQIEAIDPHPTYNKQGVLAPHTSNEESNKNQGENYFGPFNTAAIHPPSNSLFIGIGGPNYHTPGPGIDYNTTPFMKAIDMDTLKDKWPLDNQDPPHYQHVGPSMYTTAGESGLSSPAVVNDVVFCSTTKISIYAFNALDGTLLWSRDIGSQTEGYNGGYGYCLGPAIWNDYVIAGGLILGQSGGILEIYGLKE